MSWNSTKNPKIREIIKILGGSKSQTPGQLSEKLDLHEVVVSRYLKILKEDNLVKVKRDQNQLYYSLNQNQWQKHVDATMNLAGENFTKKFKEHLKMASTRKYEILREDKDEQ